MNKLFLSLLTGFAVFFLYLLACGTGSDVEVMRGVAFGGCMAITTWTCS